MGLGTIDVIAPEQNASGTSNALTLKLAAVGVRAHGERRQRASASSTARRVGLRARGAHGLLGTGPTWCLGINNGANMGDDTLYSGTVGAAMEGFLFGIPAIAFSQTEKAGHTWTPRRRGAVAPVIARFAPAAARAPGC